MGSVKSELKINKFKTGKYLDKLKRLQKEIARLQGKELSAKIVEDLRIRAKDLLVQASHEADDLKKKKILDTAARLIGRFWFGVRAVEKSLRYCRSSVNREIFRLGWVMCFFCGLVRTGLRRVMLDICVVLMFAIMLCVIDFELNIAYKKRLFI